VYGFDVIGSDLDGCYTRGDLNYVEALYQFISAPKNRVDLEHVRSGLAKLIYRDSKKQMSVSIFSGILSAYITTI